MGLEVPTVLTDFNSTWPLGADSRTQGDDHIRNMKVALLATFLFGAQGSKPAAGTANRLYFSTDTAQLELDDGSVWLNIGGGWTFLSKAANYTTVAGDTRKLILADATSGAFTIDFLAEATAGSGYHIGIIKVDSSANLVTVDDDAGATLEVLGLQGDYVEFVCDGTTWLKTARPAHFGHIYAAVGTSVTGGGGYTKMNLDTAQYDPYSLLSGPDDAIKIKKTGRYMFYAGDNAGDADKHCLIYRNGSAVGGQNIQAKVDIDGSGNKLDSVNTIVGPVACVEDDLITVYGIAENHNYTGQAVLIAQEV